MVLSMRAWGLVHGLAVLMLDGLIPSDEHLIDAAIDGASFVPKRQGRTT